MNVRSIWMLAIAITFVASLFYVRLRFLVVELSYDVSRAQSVKAKLEQERRSLTLELATLQSPSRIEKIARNDLKLTEIEAAGHVVDVRKEKR